MLRRSALELCGAALRRSALASTRGLDPNPVGTASTSIDGVARMMSSLLLHSRGYRGNGRRKDGGYGTHVEPGTPIPPEGVMALNNLRDNPHAKYDKVRVGRGNGSGKGKTAGRGHGGQNSRSGGGAPLGFEGGQTPLARTLPKRGFVNKHRMVFTPVNLGRLQDFIDAGRLDPSKTLTMKDFVDARLIDPRVKNGVKLLAKLERARDEFGNFAFDEEGNALYVPFRHTVNVEVSRVSREAKEIIESLGGGVTRVHYNKLGFRALLKPHKFPDGLPRPARPPIGLRRQVDRAGTLPAPAPPGYEAPFYYVPPETEWKPNPNIKPDGEKRKPKRQVGEGREDYSNDPSRIFGVQ